MGGAKGVVHVDIAELRQRSAEALNFFGVSLRLAPVLVLYFAFLFDVETEVFEQDDFSWLERRAGGLNLRADTVVEKLHRLAEELPPISWPPA